MLTNRKSIQMNEEENNNLTPIQKVHLFIWDIYNIIRNLNILKEFFKIKFGLKKEENLKFLIKKSSEKENELKFIEEK